MQRKEGRPELRPHAELNNLQATAMSGRHQRNTAPMLATQRCGARTRSGAPCNSPCVQGKMRCRMHGGAAGSGAPLGNKNALKSGFYTREAIAERKRLRDLLRQSHKLIMQLT